VKRKKRGGRMRGDSWWTAGRIRTGRMRQREPVGCFSRCVCLFFLLGKGGHAGISEKTVPFVVVALDLLCLRWWRRSGGNGWCWWRGRGGETRGEEVDEADEVLH
jgi:hypothetical protein